MKPIKLFVVAIALTVCAPAAAEEFAPITSAWGVKLGQVWTDMSRPDPDGNRGLVHVSSSGDETKIVTTASYYFVPTKPTPGFTKYRVLVHPDENRVSQISATGSLNFSQEEKTEEQACREIKETYLPPLEKKYGPAHVSTDITNTYVVGLKIFDYGGGWDATIQGFHGDRQLQQMLKEARARGEEDSVRVVPNELHYRHIRLACRSREGLALSYVDESVGREADRKKVEEAERKRDALKEKKKQAIEESDL